MEVRSDLYNETQFCQAAVASILLYGCTICMEKKLDDNYTRMLREILDSTLQNSSYTATYHPSRKPSKLDEPDMQDTPGEVGKNS